MYTDSHWTSFKSRGEDIPKNVYKLAKTAFGLELLNRENTSIKVQNLSELLYSFYNKNVFQIFSCVSSQNPSLNIFAAL